MSTSGPGDTSTEDAGSLSPLYSEILSCSETDLERYSPDEIKQVLVHYGLKSGGTPAERIERLQCLRSVKGDVSKVPRKYLLRVA